MEQTALIGYTGFVGGNLQAQQQFNNLYNTSNINDIDGKKFDLVVSAATYAEMWRINQEPEKDLAQINGLIEHLKTIQTKQFVLISTICVYKNPIDVTENTPVELDGLTPYGANRYHLEQVVRETFEKVLIVRLPGLFGPGLKKNVIFDFMHNNNVERIHYAGSYQYYNLAKIWQDISTALQHNLELVNFATEPLRTDEIAREVFGLDNFTNAPEGVTPASFNMKSTHAELYGGKNGYLYSKQQVLKEIKALVQTEKARPA